MTNQKNIRVFACGGAAANICSKLVTKAPGRATIEVTYVDSSRSNLAVNNVPEELTYIVPEIDGSGGVRTTNSEKINTHLSRMLTVGNTWKEGDLNIVVFSGTGGTGSVGGPMILRELLKGDQPTVALVVGSEEDQQASKNLLATMRTLTAVVRATKSPVVMGYHHNEPTVSYDLVNDNIVTTIEMLATVASGDNHGLDSKDIHHWLYYSIPTDVPPCLSLLLVNETLPENSEIISQLTLNSDRTVPPIPVGSKYSVLGHPLNTEEAVDLELLVTNDGVDELVDRLVATCQRYDRKYSHDQSRLDAQEDDLLI